MKQTLIVLTIGILLNTASIPVFAQDNASPSSTATTQKLRERIEKIVDEKRDQVQGTISDISTQRRGFIAEVQRVTQETITVKNRKGTQILSLHKDVSITKAGKTIALDTIAVGDWVIVIGTIEDDAFTPNRIIVSSTTLRPRDHQVALGSITGHTARELTVLTRTGETVSFQISTRTTRYQDSDGDKAIGTAFVKDMQVLVVGYETADGKFATTVRTIVPLDSLDDNE